MAGRLTISTLNNDTGVLAVANGMTGIPKAWVNFQGGNGNTAGTINNSFNVSSITVNGTGDFTINYTTALASAYNVPMCGAKEADSGTTDATARVKESSSNPSTTACTIVVGNSTGSVLWVTQQVFFAVFA